MLLLHDTDALNWLFSEDQYVSFLKSIKISPGDNFLLRKAKKCAARSKSWKKSKIRQKTHHGHGSWQMQKIKTWKGAHWQYLSPHVEFFHKKRPKFLWCFFLTWFFLTFPIVIALRRQGVNYRKLNKIRLGSLFCITNEKFLLVML